MLLHIADHIGKAVAGDTGIAEKLSVTDNDQGPFRAGEGNIQPCFLFQESDTPLIAASDGGVDCLLYTSDAADEEDSVDLGGRRTNKKKKNKSIVGEQRETKKRHIR